MDIIKSSLLHQCRLHFNGNGFKIVQKSFIQSSSNLQEANQLGFSCQQAHLMIKDVELLKKFRDMKLHMELGSEFIRCSTLTISSDFSNSVKERQLLDASLKRVVEQLGSDEAKDFALGNDGILRFQGRVCIPDDAEVKRLILEEGHKNRLSLHPRMTQMY